MKKRKSNFDIYNLVTNKPWTPKNIAKANRMRKEWDLERIRKQKLNKLSGEALSAGKSQKRGSKLKEVD